MCSKEVIEKLDNGEAMYFDKKRIIAGIVIAVVIFIITSYLTSWAAMSNWTGKIEQKLIDHIENPDVHMSYQAKVLSFYTRQEAELLKETLDELRAISLENQKDIKSLLRLSK